jgi:hypothetical protein
MAYTEQPTTKIKMRLLETMPPMSHAYLDEHTRGAVAHHQGAERPRATDAISGCSAARS